MRTTLFDPVCLLIVSILIPAMIEITRSSSSNPNSPNCLKFCGGTDKIIIEHDFTISELLCINSSKLLSYKSLNVKIEPLYDSCIFSRGYFFQVMIVLMLGLYALLLLFQYYF